MKNLTNVNTVVWSRDYELSLAGELQQFVPGFCHASHGEIDSKFDSLFVNPKPREFHSGGGTSKT